MKIFFLIPGDIHALTGGYLYNRHVMEGLRQRGHSISVIGTGWPWNDISEVENLCRLCFEKLPRRSCIVIDSLAHVPLHRIIREFSDRLIFTGMVHLPSSYDIHSGKKGDPGREEMQALQAMHRVIVTGKFTFELLCHAGTDPKKIFRIEPGTESFPRKRKYNQFPSTLLCIANYSPAKAQDILIRALHKLTSWKWKMHFYGAMDHHKDYFRSIESLIRQLNLENRIFLHGAVERDEISAVFLNADLFVLPSLFESFGMVLTESLAHGIPVVTTSAGNIPDSVPAGAGIFTIPGNTDHLAGALRSLLEDKERYSAMCDTASRYYLQARSWEQVTGEFEKVMENLTI